MKSERVDSQPTAAGLGQQNNTGCLLDSDIGKRVVAVVAKKFNAKEELCADVNFVADLGADSIDNVELLMALEEEFGIGIPAEASEKILTVGQAILYVNARTGDAVNQMPA